MVNTADDTSSIGPRLRMMVSVLTPLETRLVNAVLANDFDERVALKEVAARCEMSEAMVVKTAKKLGFSGFRELRSKAAEYNRLPINEMHQELSPTDTAAEIVTKVFRTSAQALEETLAILDMKAFERAAELLAKAQQRDFYGFGGSAQIARDAVHKFLRIGARATAWDDPHMMLMSASLLGKNDVVLAISHSGQTKDILEAVRAAQANHVPVIAITNYSGSPLANLADTVLCSTAQGSPLTGENAAARVAQLNILDALFVVVAQSDYAHAEQQLNRTMMAVAHKRK
ncbi:MurR/RpiR family transcriptional regulator [Erwinia persicina]|uniref:MurR/RpiR family transcriptional regulator n=1 Tax=Erwinia persicina TaxID=55211 RepID=UPI002108460F|nr:MurR/RpiR family transcriptional regulator [Erwinia persicina]MCQ4093215.1 MurR/RpiR family transcriptional regulator [Erwinia persicina]MCQ4098983.1 MurR/RpiR family transcriptional regulator [Erwinia persicina]MCQ4104707.1 MurR/RpiR family transcriptional regulator [Erwinia persicina]UTX14402.1 MurR/RpiR family transcriptional regulator [Erwinia persicina]